MDIDLFRHKDINDFLSLATTEGWISDRWEFEFLLGQFPQGCLLAREEGTPAGYVTAIKYGESGWIGNLLVSREFRRQGVGGALMERALAALADAGAETVWLSASRQGKPIYERLGFTTVDVINRWVGTGLWNGPSGRSVGSRSEILAIDRAGWGDSRDALIEAAARRGTLFCAEGAFLVSQQCGDCVQFGPWGGAGASAPLLLSEALLEAGKGTKVVLDVPIRNTGQTALLLGRGFLIRGSALLMYRGKEPDYAPEQIGALASMGSMG